MPSALLGGGFAPGLGLCCEGLAPAFDFLALAGVPSPCLPVAFWGGGGGFWDSPSSSSGWVARIVYKV